MRQNDLRSLRVRQKRRSYTRLFALLGCVLVVALVCGAYGYLSAADEPPARAAATSPMKASTETPTASPAPRESSAAEPIREEAKEPPEERTSNPAATASTGKSILIKKSEFRLYLLEDGNVVDSWPVALGKNAGQKRVSGDMKTPDGTFPIDEMLDASYWTHDFGDGKGEIAGAYGPWFIRLDTGGWKGIGIHGTHAPDSLGTMASEGCIRMNNDEIRDLKNYAYRNMIVRIEK